MSSDSHKRWMSKLNEFSKRHNRSWKNSVQKLPPQSPLVEKSDKTQNLRKLNNLLNNFGDQHHPRKSRTPDCDYTR